MDIYFGCILSDEKQAPSNSDILVLARKPYTGETHYYKKHWNLIALTQQGYDSNEFKQWVITNTLHSSSIIKTETPINVLKSLETLTEELEILFSLKTPNGYSDPQEIKELNLFIIKYAHHTLNQSLPVINPINMRSAIFKLIGDPKDILNYL